MESIEDLKTEIEMLKKEVAKLKEQNLLLIYDFIVNGLKKKENELLVENDSVKEINKLHEGDK